MTPRLLLLPVLLAALAPLAAAQANDQPSTRAVHGIVVNSSGSPVEGAVVQLKDTKSLEIRSYITQSGGAYHFAGLDGGLEYELRASFHGASSSSKTLSVFDTRKDPRVDLKLKK